MIWAFGIALLLDVAGLALAALGFNQTWNEHGTGKLWDPWILGGRRSVRRLYFRARRLLGLPGRHVRLTGAATGVTVGFGTPTVVIGLPRLPDPSDVEAFASAVQQQLDELHSRATRQDSALNKERQARGQADQMIRDDLGREIGRVEELTKTVATGGLRLQILGWLLLLAGVVLGGVLNMVSAATA